MKIQWRKLGFTQKKPTEHGVYFVHPGYDLDHPSPRNKEGWDIAEISFFAGSYSNFYEMTESQGCWRIKRLEGIEDVWKSGMWIKGPITPFQTEAK